MTLDSLLLVPHTWQEIVAAWLFLNLLPFSIVGMLLLAVEFGLPHRPRAQRFGFAFVVIGLVISTGCTTVTVAHRAVVIYDYCQSPDIPCGSGCSRARFAKRSSAKAMEVSSPMNAFTRDVRCCSILSIASACSIAPA
jgi:hypothetical protein